MKSQVRIIKPRTTFSEVTEGYRAAVAPVYEPLVTDVTRKNLEAILEHFKPKEVK